MRSCCIALGTISSHLRWNMMEYNVRKKSIYMCVYVCYWVILLYSRKLTEHCKPIIMEKIKIIKKLKIKNSILFIQLLLGISGELVQGSPSYKNPPAVQVTGWPSIFPGSASMGSINHGSCTKFTVCCWLNPQIRTHR